MKRPERSVTGIALLIFLISSLAACAGVEEKLPEKQYFVLDVSRNGDSPSVEAELILEVRDLIVSSPYENRNLVYRTGDLSFATDHYNEFFIPPGALLTREVREWLRASGLFEHVAGNAGRLEPAYTLEGSVSALYGDYSDQRGPKAVITVRVLVTRNLTIPPEVAFTKEYHQETPITERYPEGLIRGWNAALKQILTDLETDLRVHVTQPGS